jgi:HAD superfamily hydrolase (TIGR01484 family)
MTGPLRFAAFDLDGTLLDARYRLLPGVVEGIRRLRRLGLTPVLVTGRSLAGLRAAGIDRSLLPLMDSRILVSDGDAVFDRRNGRFHQTRRLPESVRSRLADAGCTDLAVEVDGQYRASNKRTALAVAMTYRLPRAAVTVGPVDAAAPLGRVLVFGDPKRTTDALLGVRHSARRLKSFAAMLVQPEGTCKSRALRAHLLAEFGEHGLDRVIAFGDGANDAALLMDSRVGVAMPDSDDAAKAAASIRLTEPIGDFLRVLEPQRLYGGAAGCAAPAATAEALTE